jgi:hypothetical protein
MNLKVPDLDIGNDLKIHENYSATLALPIVALTNFNDGDHKM